MTYLLYMYTTVYAGRVDGILYVLASPLWKAMSLTVNNSGKDLCKRE